METSTGNLWDFSPFMGPAPANCPSSRAGRVEVVGMKKYWELKPHIWVFVENGLRQNHSFPLSL